MKVYMWLAVNDGIVSSLHALDADVRDNCLQIDDSPIYVA
jgi:hypothetical protein